MMMTRSKIRMTIKRMTKKKTKRKKTMMMIRMKSPKQRITQTKI